MTNVIFSVCIVLMALLAGCGPRSVAQSEGAATVVPEKEKLKFTRDFIAIINRADKITVSEHSSKGDFVDSEAEGTLHPDKLVYEVRELTADQTAAFVSAVEDLDKTLQDAMLNSIKEFGPSDAASACIFQPHHTIAFMAGERLLSKIEVCFVCGQVKGDVSKSDTPPALVATLYQFIQQIGLHPKRDWEALAKSHPKSVQ